MDNERHLETGRTAIPLTRADVEHLLSSAKSPAGLDLGFQNLQQINLSYMDLQGANLQGADLQAANLCGTNLRGANLQGANLSEADLDGADLSGARLGENEANRVKFSRTRLSYATLRELDLRGFDLTGLDLQNADLNGSDLREAVLQGTDLQGADLSTARLNGPELRGAILHRRAFLGNRQEPAGRRKRTQMRLALTTQEKARIQEPSLSLQKREGRQNKHRGNRIMSASSQPTCTIIRSQSQGTYEGKQGLTYFAGISAESAGAQHLCLHLLTLPPGERARVHLHANHESAIYMLHGEAEMWYGEGLQEYAVVQAGDFIYIPAGVPHVPGNKSQSETCTALIARTDPNEQESVVLLPELEDVLPQSQ